MHAYKHVVFISGDEFYQILTFKLRTKNHCLSVGADPGHCGGGEHQDRRGRVSVLQTGSQLFGRESEVAGDSAVALPLLSRRAQEHQGPGSFTRPSSDPLNALAHLIQWSHPQKLHVFLFELALVLSRPGEDKVGGQVFHVYRQPLPNALINLEEIPDGEAGGGSSFRGAFTGGNDKGSQLTSHAWQGFYSRIHKPAGGPQKTVGSIHLKVHCIKFDLMCDFDIVKRRTYCTAHKYMIKKAYSPCNKVIWFSYPCNDAHR